MTLLSTLISEKPEIYNFWLLETYVSSAARTVPLGLRTPLTCDIEPEFRSTPPKWDLILTEAYDRGLRAG